MKQLRNLPITTKLTLLFALFAALILVGVGVQAYLSGRAAMEQAVISDLESTANEKQAAFNQWLNDRLNLVVSITGFPAYRARVNSLIHDNLDAAARKTLTDQTAQALAGFSGPIGNYTEMMIVEADQGQVIVSTQPENQGKFNEDRPYFIEGMKGPFVQNFIYSLNEGAPLLIVAAPLKADDGSVIAVLAARLKLDQMNEIILRRTGQRLTDDAYLVNPSNLYVTQPRFINDPAVLQRGIYTEQVNRCLAGNSGVLTGNDYRSVPVLAVYHWMSERQLCLIVELDQFEAFASVQSFGRALALVGGLVLLVATLLAFWLARTITRPLQALRLGVERFGQGQLDLRISTTSTDEVGQLVHEFNQMADSLSQKDAQLQVYASDLEQKVQQRTAQLAAGEERYRTVADYTYDWEYWIGPDQKFLYISPSCERITGYRTEEYIADPKLLDSIVYPEDRPVIAEHQVQIRNNDDELSIHEVDFRILRRDGAVRWIGHTCQSIWRLDGTNLGRRATNRDITERKIAEDQIRKLNRVLSVLSDTNQAIVRIREPAVLFETVCQLAVEKGGFIFAWIGMTDPATGKIKQVGVAGNSNGYLEKLLIAINESSPGQHPIMDLLQNGKLCLCNALENDPLLAFLRPEINQLGFRSAAALPLLVTGKLRGLINLYSNETGFFDDEELKLLDEMALDLSYALEFADQEADRRQAEEALKKSEALLGEMGKVGQIGGWEFDVDTLKQTWTEEVYRIHEVDLTYDPTVGEGIDFYGPTSKPIIERVVQRAIEFGEPYDLELEIISAKGNHRWVHTIGKARQVENKTKTVYGTFQDITDKKRAEEEISSLAKFPSENPNPVMRIQQDGTLLYANEVSFSMLQAWNLAIGQLVPKELKEVVVETMAAGKGQTIDLEINQRIISFNVVPLKDAGYANLYGRDVTDRRHSEQALKKSEQRYRSLFENMLEGYAYCQMIFVEDQPQDFIYLDVNTAFEQLTGLKDVVGKYVSTVIPGLRASNPELFEIYGRVALTGTPERFEDYVAPLKMWFSISVYSYEKEYFIAVFDNITERKRAEKALRESEDKFKYIFDYSTVGKSITLPSGKIQVNNAFCEMLGYSPEELQNKSWQDITHPDDVEITQKEINALLTGEKEFARFTKRYLQKNGSMVWADVSTSLRREKEGQPLYFMTTLVDITERKHAEEEIRILNLELEQRVAQRTQQLESVNKELEAFAYSVSHDLRAPLRAIDGFSRIIVDDYADRLDAEGNRLLNIIRTNTAKMDQLIIDLLALSRAARLEMRISRVDMAVLANSIYHEIASPAVQHKFTFTVTAMPDAYGDSTLLRQVWANLLSNAIKYTLPREECRIEAGGYRQDEMNVYYVKDSGVGFNPEYTHKLFGVFQRLHKIEDFEGTGVGLAIVQRIIQRHEGKVWGEGQLNQGATFYFSLPVSQEVKDDRSRS